MERGQLQKFGSWQSRWMAKNLISGPEKYEDLENNSSYTTEFSVAEECVAWECRGIGGYKQRGVGDGQA